MCLVYLIILAFVIGLSLAITAGLIYLICLCFGLAFSWPVAIGIWLVIILLRSIFSKEC